MCLPLTLIVYRHCIDFLFFCIFVFFFKNRFFKVRSLPASLTLHALKGSLPSFTLRFYPCSRRLPFYMITSLWQPTKKRAVLIEWGGFFHLFKKKNSRNNLKINNNYHYYAYENWKKKGNEGMMLIASGSTACKNEMVSLCCCGKVDLQLILLEISFWNKRKNKRRKEKSKGKLTERNIHWSYRSRSITNCRFIAQITDGSMILGFFHSISDYIM